MRRIVLRKFNYQKDLESFFDYMTNEDSQIMISHHFQSHNIEMFEHWITTQFKNGAYHDFFMLETENGATIGFTFSYDFFVYDGHCKYTLCLFKEYQNMGYGVIAGIEMMDYLFRNYPLSRIFISIFDYNKNSLKINLKGGFEEVGLLPEYRYWGGEKHSLHILTISRDAFYVRYRKPLKLIQNGGKQND